MAENGNSLVLPDWAKKYAKDIVYGIIALILGGGTITNLITPEQEQEAMKLENAQQDARLQALEKKQGEHTDEWIKHFEAINDPETDKKKAKETEAHQLTHMNKTQLDALELKLENHRNQHH